MTFHRSILFVMATAAGMVGCGFPGADPGQDALPPVTVQFSADSSLEDEASGEVLVPVMLMPVSTIPVSVGFSVTAGTATEGDDFMAPAGTLSFSPGEFEKFIRVTIVSDGLEEDDETIQLTLDSVAGAVLGQRNHTITINSDILPRIGFTEISSNAAEDQATQFLLAMDMPSTTGDVSVDYSVSAPVVGPGATPVADYALASGTITIPMGGTMAMLDLGEVDDQLDEEDSEGVVVTLSGAVDVVIAAGMGVRTHGIEDDDPLPSIGFATGTSSQSEAGGAGSIPVTLNTASGRTVSVSYTVVGGTAGSGDITIAASGTLTFLAGDTQEDIPLNVLTDTLDEDNEYTDLLLSNQVNATLPPASADHRFTITDDDPEPTIQFLSAAQTIEEAATTLNLQVTLSAASGKDISFTFGQGGGSTVNASDYAFTTTSPVTIPAGQGGATIDVAYNEDMTSEPTELLNVDLTGATNATVGGTNRHALTITDDDIVTPNVSFDPMQMNGSVNEGDSGTTQFDYDVVLDQAAGSTVTVNVAFTGSAMIGPFPQDFTVGTGDVPVTFTAGQTRRTIRLFIVGDMSNESGNSQDITMTLNTPTGAVIVTPSVRVHNILDDD